MNLMKIATMQSSSLWHIEFLDMEIDFVKRLGKKNFVLFDVKSVFDVANVDGAL